jgi:hypothetical protein
MPSPFRPSRPLPLPELSQTTPRKKRISANSSKYWLSGYPHLVAQWHPTRNGELYPDILRYGSSREIWWKCPKGPDHEWMRSVTARVRGAGCPFCDNKSNKYVSVTNSLATLHPEIAKTWHPTKNGKRTPRDVVAGTGDRVWWRCPVAADHVWTSCVVTRTRSGSGCPFCVGNRVVRSNCLATVAPKLAREWHPTKNGTLTPRDVTRGSTRRVWWRCAKDAMHVWQSSVGGRGGASGYGCPFCAGVRVTPTTSLAALHPEIAKSWHPTKNGSLTPKDVKSHTDQPIWWTCILGHVWQRSPARQLRHGACPFCSGHSVAKDNCLRTLYPALAREWHPTKNGEATPDTVTARTERRVWWQCGRDPRHLWESSIHSRTNRDPPTGCPHCWAIRRCGAKPAR